MRRVCQLNDLHEGTALLARLEARHLLLYRNNDTVHAYLNRCPHLGVPLAWQQGQLWDKEHNFLQCSTHGALFIPESGECISGPCQGDFLWSVSCSVHENTVYIDESELPPLTQITT